MYFHLLNWCSSHSLDTFAALKLNKKLPTGKKIAGTKFLHHFAKTVVKGEVVGVYLASAKFLECFQKETIAPSASAPVVGQVPLTMPSTASLATSFFATPLATPMTTTPTPASGTLMMTPAQRFPVYDSHRHSAGIYNINP